MATTMAVDFDNTESRVTFQELTVYDDELVDFLIGFNENRREDAVVRALKVGAATLRLSETTTDLEHVREPGAPAGV